MWINIAVTGSMMMFFTLTIARFFGRSRSQAIRLLHGWTFFIGAVMFFGGLTVALWTGGE